MGSDPCTSALVCIQDKFECLWEGKVALACVGPGRFAGFNCLPWLLEEREGGSRKGGEDG